MQAVVIARRLRLFGGIESARYQRQQQPGAGQYHHIASRALHESAPVLELCAE
jgi:hypothetical protein